MLMKSNSMNATGLSFWGGIFSIFLSPLVCNSGVAESPQAVRFDVPAIVVAEPLEAAISNAPTTGGSLFRIRMPVSTLIHPNFSGQIDEFVVEIECPSRALRVLDFWPKTELYSSIDGSIAIENREQDHQNLAFQISGGHEPFGRGSASGDYHKEQQTEMRYQRRPPMQMLTSSGTIGRGYGVFYKFRPGPTPVLEGDREIAILVEAPAGWRGDLLHVTMRAVATESSLMSSHASRTVGAVQMSTAVHRSGDPQAAEAARRFIITEQTVRRLAESHHQAIQHRSFPTVFHRVGAALEVVEPKIPGDFLNQILFNLNPQYFDSATSRLPVDLRVAALDYWDERAKLMTLASNHF